MAFFGRKRVEPVEQVDEPESEPSLPTAPDLNEEGLRSVADHRDYLLSLVEPLKPFGMSLLEAYDQVMCEDIDSMINVPATSTSRVDGFAVRVSDLNPQEATPTLRLQTEGHDRLQPGEAIEVKVGDVLPRGTTAVAPHEFVEVADGIVCIFEMITEGDYVRSAGEHLAVGTRLLSEGEVLGDRAIGMLASAGIDKVLVRPRPRVVVISSGSDLVDPGAQLRHGQQNDTNSFMIAAAAKAAGATVFRVAALGRDKEYLKQVISDQLIRADLLISTTGGHREDYEVVAEAMSELGLVDSVDVAMTPGRTQTFGLIGVDQVPMVMMPGNPVSAYVSFQAFVWPLIRRLAGADVTRKTTRAIVSSGLRSVSGQLHLLRGYMNSEHNVRRVERIQDPYALAELTRSNCLIVLDENTQNVRGGDSVQCWLLDEE